MIRAVALDARIREALVNFDLTVRARVATIAFTAERLEAVDAAPIGRAGV